eukprot:gnl/Spiro4/20956_TR10211_c0_g1_i1.p2 gnl/Spiro4/20956_TR10211_c0_g1~~gnl/Spiro4/20956_TR10211_c0_g1_i1.p2  ORF type:complete len:611 (-),score=122.26 gnl/Spiro4/20956_TR10211_c0_g1_i1:3212-5044(-)
MSTEIDLSSAPYFDDTDAKKDYYRVLFKPSVPVQTRELNQLQALLQAQIEKFGDNILQKGTIISGCNFAFHTTYPYVKIKDIDVNGVATVPSLYQGMFVKNSSNLVGYIVNYADGFEATAPDLKTLYVSYVSSGDDGDATAFIPGETLTVYDPASTIYSIVVNNGGLSFQNNDTVVITSALVVKVDSGTFTVGENIICPTTGANVKITAIDTTLKAPQGLTVLSVTPRTVDLANGSANSMAWSFNVNDSIINVSNTVTADVVDFLGSGATAKLTTNPVGKITGVRLTNRGEGYLLPPDVKVQSANNSAGIAVLNLVAANFITQIKVASGGDAVGSGYAFGIQEGYIYQKGFFLRAEQQVAIISKYDPSPNNVVVGFNTVEEIVDYNIDPSLLDNATGEPNETAPGADRLKLTPQLVVMTVEESHANADFFALAEWSGGFPYRQNQYTQYSKIGDEMAQRTYDESGNFVIDTFQVATTSVANGQNEGKYYTAVIDPGQAYISGKKVQTLRNYYIDVEKGIDSKTSPSYISMNYGNYIRLNQLGGLFQFSTGDTVDLYDTAQTYLTRFAANSAIDLSGVGNKIGTARIRSLVLENGVPGDPNAIFQLYLFAT